MSNKTEAWVWHDAATENLNLRDFVVLLALADIADDDGFVRFAKRKPHGRRRDDLTAEEQERLGDQKALAKKAHMSIATFRRATHDLESLGLLEISRATATAVNEYRVLMTTAQPDLWITPSTTAQSERSHRSPGERSHRSAVSDQRDVINIQISQSSTEVTTEAREVVPASTTDHDHDQPRPARGNIFKRLLGGPQVDYPAISAEIRTRFPELRDEAGLDDVLDQLAGEILRKAPYRVEWPTAYVLRVLLDDQPWTDRLFHSFDLGGERVF
jgi:hypothetical protein